MKQSDISSSSTTSSKQCGCSPSSTPVVGSFQFANISSFGMGTGCPSFAELNTLQQQLIDMQNAHESGQVQGFNADYAQRIGGYPKTALVSDPNDPTRLFISKADDNTADPTKDTTGAWFPLTDTLTATRDAIAKEEQRARSAEAALQPKGDYATNESLNAETERAKSIESTLQPKGDYATQHDLSAETQRAQSAEAALQPKGDYATNESLNAETERAKSIEATLQPKGDYATQHDLSAETQRAQNAENQLMPRSGGTMSGSLVLSVTEKWSFGRGGGVTTQAMADGPERFYQQIYRGNGGLTQGILGVADETGDRQWKLLANSAILTPKGNTLLEIAGATTPMKVQSFIATTDNGFTVSFPQAFGGPPTSININAMEADWDVGPQAGTWTATGFRVTNYSSNTKGSPQQVSIIAVGPA